MPYGINYIARKGSIAQKHKDSATVVKPRSAETYDSSPLSKRPGAYTGRVFPRSYVFRFQQRYTSYIRRSTGALLCFQQCCCFFGQSEACTFRVHYPPNLRIEQFNMQLLSRQQCASARPADHSPSVSRAPLLHAAPAQQHRARLVVCSDAPEQVQLRADPATSSSSAEAPTDPPSKQPATGVLAAQQRCADSAAAWQAQAVARCICTPLVFIFCIVHHQCCIHHAVVASVLSGTPDKPQLQWAEVSTYVHDASLLSHSQ